MEVPVLEYERSIAFFDGMFAWLGYRSTYSMARFPFFHSYIGVQPAQSGPVPRHADHATGRHRIALRARSRRKVDDFHREFLLPNGVVVTDEPAEYPVYTPGYYAVFFDDPFAGIHFELGHTPMVPSPAALLRWRKAPTSVWRSRPQWRVAPWKQAMRDLPSRNRRSGRFGRGRDESG